MTKTNTLLFLPTVRRSTGVTFVPATTTTEQLLVTAGTEDSDVIMLEVTTDETAAANDLILTKFNGTTSFVIGHIDIPVNSGTDGTAIRINGLNPLNLPGLLTNNAGNYFIPLASGWSLRAKMRVTVATSKTVTVLTTVVDYS